MSQKSFREIFLDSILNFLWRQWSALGVLGEAQTKDPWVLDPEPMLLFTLEMGRYEPRLFDELLDWLSVNGSWMDIQRMRRIMRGKEETVKRLMGAIATFLTQETNERKWGNLAKLCKTSGQETPYRGEPLFYNKDGTPQPIADKSDPSFLSCGFNRSQVTIRRMSREVPITSQSTIRFLLRSLFGVGSRAECVLYLLTHDGGHPAEVAKAVGISVRGTQDALIDLSRSGLVLTRIKGKRKIEYWLSQERWWEFLSKGSITEIKKPLWIDWIALYSALSQIWSVLNEVSREGISDYMRSSKLRDALEVVGSEFSRSGLDIPSIPGKNLRPQEYEQAFEAFITRVFGG